MEVEKRLVAQMEVGTVEIAPRHLNQSVRRPELFDELPVCHPLLVGVNDLVLGKGWTRSRPSMVVRVVVPTSHGRWSSSTSR